MSALRESFPVFLLDISNLLLGKSMPSYTYFAKVFDESRFEVVSLSTYNDLARWFLGRKEKVTAPEKRRFIFENFDPATIKK